MAFNGGIFAQNMRDARAKLNVSQSMFARMVGLSVDTVRQYEHCAVCNPTANTIFKVSEVTHISPNELLGWKDED